MSSLASCEISKQKPSGLTPEGNLHAVHFMGELLFGNKLLIWFFLGSHVFITTGQRGVCSSRDYSMRSETFTTGVEGGGQIPPRRGPLVEESNENKQNTKDASRTLSILFLTCCTSLRPVSSSRFSRVTRRFVISSTFSFLITRSNAPH